MSHGEKQNSETLIICLSDLMEGATSYCQFFNKMLTSFQYINYDIVNIFVTSVYKSINCVNQLLKKPKKQ
jgi:hypothetical protein